MSTQQMAVTNHDKILDQLNIVDIRISSFSGFVTRDDVETDDARTAGGLRVVHRAHTNSFSSIRQAARRACVGSGIALSGGFAVPDEAMDGLMQTLSGLSESFFKSKEYLLNNYETLKNQWADENPMVRDKILARAPTAESIASKIDFGVSIYKINSQPQHLQGLKISNGVEQEVGGLVGRLAYEISADVKANWSNSGIAGAKTLEYLKRIHAKIKSLAFIDPRVAEISQFIEATLTKFPSGKIEGNDYLIFAGLMSILGNEKALLSGNLAVTIEESPAEAPVADVVTNEQEGIQSHSLFEEDEFVNEAATVASEIFDVDGDVDGDGDGDGDLSVDPDTTVVIPVDVAENKPSYAW